jgi:hypothetical protein
MLKRNYCIDLLIENATTYTEKSKIYSLTEAEQAIVNDKMVGNLYQSALKRKNIDFGDIPNSKGDIQKFGGYQNMVATVDMLRELSKKFGIQIPELNIVDDAINNIRIQKRTFERGYSLGIDFIKMYYQALVLACVDATTLLLASYVEFTRTVNNIDFQIKSGKGISGNICINSLDEFNKSVKDGSFIKFADGLMSKKQENFLGTAAAASVGVKTVAAIAIGASIVPTLRLLIFYFYDAKMTLSEKLAYQKELLEMNAFRLNASNMDAQKRNKILDKQKRYMDNLEKISDKIRVSDQLATKSSTNSIKQDNKQWNINNVTDNGDDFMFI